VFAQPPARGWGAILAYGDRKRELSGGEPKTTNNKMEQRAVIEGLRALNQPCRVSVYSDSEYVVNAFNKDWFAGWERRGWRNSEWEAGSQQGALGGTANRG
jgi:ribonuclease HI